MTESETYDYVVVGGGAAGCVVAARLAQAGLEVLLLEAGNDPLVEDTSGPPPVSSSPPRPVADDYSVPAFHTFASENPAMKWDFYVRHYSDDAAQQADKKYRGTLDDGEEVDGVLYPRSTGLGGCAGHHAMIIVRPRNADWNHIWNVTGDASWKASNMNRYYARMERCRYGNRFWRFWAKLTGRNPTGHGWDGWLTTERAMPLRTIRDWRLRQAIKYSLLAASAIMPKAAERWGWLVRSGGDPNDQRIIDADGWGLFVAPLATARHARSGPREFLVETLAKRPDRLTVRMNVFATRVEIDKTSKRAVAVYYREGSRLYRAAAKPHGAAGEERRVVARREIILCGGAFNTPQLLMLSGVGDPSHLAEHGVDVAHPLPGVGRNLQDRYEIGVVSRMKKPWDALRGADYEVNDAYYRLWARWPWLRVGPYTSNGAMFSALFPSKWGRGRADLYCFALLADFHGYFPRYSQLIKKRNYMSWIILKAYTRNDRGSVRLRSRDPFERPDINFRYFHEGAEDWREDLDAVVQGVKFVRKVADYLDDLVEEEEIPGRNVCDDAQLRDFVRANAWGHHACGTCAMKPLEDGGVVDSRFRVHGVGNLRVVDASIFPRIPGYFIVSSIYMVAEKAADDIIDAARAGQA